MDDFYFGELAFIAASQSTCLRRKFGCIIVDPKTKHPISTGYNGAPSGHEDCVELGWCLREELQIPRGECYSICRSTHAEQNALIRAGMRDTYGAHMYISGFDVSTNLPVVDPKPCFLCTKMIINAHIEKVFIYNKRNLIEVDVNELYNQYVAEIGKRHSELA